MARITQEEMDRRIAAFGGAALVHSPTAGKQKVPNPAYGFGPGQDPLVPKEIEVAVHRWKGADGAELEAYQLPDGSWETTREQPAPAKPTASTTPRTPEQTRADAANATEAETKAQEAIRIRNESQWNADPANKDKPGWSGRYETHADRDARLDKEKKEAEARSQSAATAAAASRRADSAEARAVAEANRVGSKVDDITVAGQHYTRITKTSADGKTTVIENYGPDGKQIPAIPGEGAATAGGPPMPQIVVGMTEQALTAYHTALWNDPTLTPATREKRFQEAVQVANLATQNAATQQREMESQRNAEYNVAGSKLTFLKGGMDSALKFVGDLNGTLPKGSDLGGRAFAAILGLQMLQMKMSGIDDLTKPGTSASRAQVPTITARDLSNNAALTSHNATIATQAAAAADPPPVSPAAAPAAATSSAPRPAAAQAAPASAAPASAPMSAVPPTIADPTITDQTYIGSPAGVGSSPSATAPAPPSPDTTANPGAQPWGQPVTAPVGGSVLPQPAPTLAAPFQDDQQEPAQLPYATPADMVPGARIQVPGEAPGVWVPYPDDSDPAHVSQMQPSDWPALAGMQMGPAPPPQQPSGMPGATMGDPAMMAARRAQIAATPPWRLGDDDWEWANQNGLLDDARRVPSMGRVA